MKKILLIIPAIGAVYGGPSKIALRFAAALSRHGHVVDLVTTDADGSNRIELPCNTWVDQDGFRLRCFARYGRSEFKFSWSMLTWLLCHVGEYDVVHITSCFNFPVLAAALACRRWGKRYLVAPQGMLEPWALDYKAGKKKVYLRWVERPLILRRASAIQALNCNEAANIRALSFGPPVVVVPNGIDASDVPTKHSFGAQAFLDRYPSLQGKTLILFLHRVDPKKGLDLLATAYAFVRAEFPETHLVVAGPATPGFEETARQYFHKAGVLDSVTFTGMLDGVLKQSAFAAATVFVAPTYSEGFSMAVLEAMASKLPCVITTGCNFPEANEAGAAKVVPVDADAFAGALLEVLHNPAASRAMGQRAAELVLSNYTWDQIAAHFGTL